MAGLLDDFKEKSNGLLGQLNDYLFKDSKYSLGENISNAINPPTSTILNRLQTQQQAEKVLTPEKISGYFNKLTSQAPASELSYRSEAEKQAAIAKEQQAKAVPTTQPQPESDKDSVLKRVLSKEVLAWFDKAGTSWKDSGGFEKLMADPGFLIGLGILENAANGKSIGSGALDSMVKAGAISSAYADRIKARAKIQGPITSAEREEAKAVLAESDLGETASISTRFKNFILGKNTEALNTRALDDIAERARSNMEKDATSGTGKTVRSRREYYEDAAKQLVKEGKIKIDEGFWILGGGVQSTKPGLTNINKIPEKNKRQLGGPVSKDTSYLVGEVGPEVFIPKVSGKIVSNDDSKIINLLLEANPQLKNVSPARAEKILRNRFPDYFE
jgi:polyhydroxyalkanoate synthesis regulator phasin